MTRPPLASFTGTTTRPPLSSFSLVKPPLTGSQLLDQKSAEMYGASYPSVTGEGPTVAGFKTAGNLPSSAFTFGKGMYDFAKQALLHPVDTTMGIGNAIEGSLSKGIDTLTGTKSFGLQGNEKAQDFADKGLPALAVYAKERYGSMENLQRSVTNDPFGVATDILALASGGAGLVGKEAELARLISKTGQLVTKPTGAAVKGTVNLANKTTKFGVSQATGLAPETISNIVKNPADFSKEALQTANRETLGTAVKSAIDTRLKALSTTGEGYEAIRTSPDVVTIPQNTITDLLKKNGIELVDGKVKTTSEAKMLSTADKTALQDFMGVFGDEAKLSSNAFLNAREALSTLSKYDAAKTGNLTPLFRDLRATYDSFGKAQIKGLTELDAKYAPEVKTLKQIKKDYLQKDGSFKDGAVNKIANLTGMGKEQVLGRLEQIVPGIEQRVKIVKAAEDIERASGLKVGTYARAGVGLFGATTGNIPAIIGAILASPEIAVKLLRAYGLSKSAMAEVANVLRKMGNDVGGFRLHGKYNDYIKEYIGSKDTNSPEILRDLAKQNNVDFEKLNTEIDTKLSKAKAWKEYLDAEAMKVAKGVPGVRVAKAPVKSKERILEKTLKEESGELENIKDIARNTIVPKTSKASAEIFKRMDARKDIFKRRDQKPEDFMGYEGTIYNIKTPDGQIVETQVVSPAMTFGKNLPEFSKNVLGEELFNDIAKRTGLKPGQGHEFYEQWRTMSIADRESPLGAELIKASFDYYSKLR